jgi:hypothetical protein
VLRLRKASNPEEQERVGTLNLGMKKRREHPTFSIEHRTPKERLPVALGVEY